MPHTRAAEAESLAMSVTPHVFVGMSDALGSLVWRKGLAALWTLIAVEP
jgi:hypothetical protein